MTPMLRRALAMALAGLFLTGCDVRQRLQSPEDRVNAAMPLGIELRQAQERLLAQIGEASPRRAESDKAWTARLRARALTCSPDFTPSWRHSDAQVRAAVGNKACFADVDRSLARWIGMQRVRLLLEQPAAPSGTVPASITLPGAVTSWGQGVSPVLAALSQDGLELVRLDGGVSPFKESGARSEINVAPNGRLFAQSTGDAVRLRASEGGETLLELPGTPSVRWLGTSLLAVRGSNGRPWIVISLATGEEAPIGGRGMSSYELLLPVPKQPDRFDVVSYQGLFQYEAEVRDGRFTVTQTMEKPGADQRLMLGSADAGQLSADGSEWVMAASQKLVRLDLTTLEVKEHLFGPVTVKAATPTAKPAQFVVELRMPDVADSAASSAGNYLFDAEAGTLARVEGVAAQRPIRYLAGIQRLTHASHPTLWLAERLDTAAPVPMRNVVATLLDEANQAKLARVAAEERRLEQTPPILAASALVPGLADAPVEGVGVYEAREKVAQPGNTRSTGRVVVKVRRTARPMVLVLSSYEPVQWVLRLEPGARLGAVLLGGYYDSAVQGAGETRVLKIGRVYAYGHEDAKLPALQREVTRWAGRPMGLFQGMYAGDSFSVGGN